MSLSEKIYFPCQNIPQPSLGQCYLLSVPFLSHIIYKVNKNNENLMIYYAEVYRVKVRRKGAPPQTATFHRLIDARKWSQMTEGSVLDGRYFKTLVLACG